MLRRKKKRQGDVQEPENAETKLRRKRSASDSTDEESERTLERLVFGGERDVIRELDKDFDGHSISSDEEKDVFEDTSKEKREILTEERRPAWVDEDDENEQVDISSESRLKKFRDLEEEVVVSGKKFTQKLKKHFTRIYGEASWADLNRRKETDSQSEVEDDDSFLQRAGHLLSAKAEHLPHGIIGIAKAKDANIDNRSNASVRCLEFHPCAKVLLTAGFNKTLNLFQIDGQTNPKLQSIFLDRFPIHTAHFSADGEQVILTSWRKSFYVYDMMSGEVVKIPQIRGQEEKRFDRFVVSPDGKILVFLGDNGYLILLSSKTKQRIGSLKMNGSVCSVAFNVDGTRMFTAGDDGEVYVWNMDTRSCVHKFRDEGCLKATALAVSRDGQYLACGSDSGVVNVYDKQCLHDSKPKPLKSIMNLTTTINNTLFNSSSEILAISSRNCKNALRMIHLPSLTVFSNWPTSRTSLNYVQSLDFSPNSGYLSIGNDRGKALLYRLKHFTDS